MAYDEGLAQRVREIIEVEPLSSEKKMFGGLCFLLGGNMACGIVSSELMVRVGADAYDEALSKPHAREMDFTGRALKGMIYVDEDGVSEDEDLADWVRRGVDFAGALPPKRAKGDNARNASGKSKKK